MAVDNDNNVGLYESEKNQKAYRPLLIAKVIGTGQGRTTSCHNRSYSTQKPSQEFLMTHLFVACIWKQAVHEQRRTERRLFSVDPNSSTGYLVPLGLSEH